MDRKAELKALRSLSNNWNGYGAEAPRACSIYMAEFLLYVLQNKNFPPSKVMPSVNGGVAICFIRGEQYADFECFNTGEILAVTSEPGT
jgi:hypothetical protein